MSDDEKIFTVIVIRLIHEALF